MCINEKKQRVWIPRGQFQMAATRSGFEREKKLWTTIFPNSAVSFHPHNKSIFQPQLFVSATWDESTNTKMKTNWNHTQQTPYIWFSHYIDIHFFNINIVWRSTYLIYKRYTPERGKARVCVIPFDDMSASSKRIIRASHDQGAPPASNLDHEAPTPLPSWLLLGLCVRPTKGVRIPKCVWVRSQIIFLDLARFRQP